ncbi:MAG: phytoene dehydrogenase [Polyangiaceae bacterium]|nr:phytoene dehydrogenase [Polyangiaceae bacterium]
MSSRHFDAIVLGRSLGALTAAVLLARRSLRVLLLGQGQRPPEYTFDRFRLRRRTFSLLAGTTPIWRRVLQELAQTPRFRRRIGSLDPMFTMLWEGRYVEVPPDLDLFAREVDREFPEVRQLVDELYSTIAYVNGAADIALERDVVWPPGSFWETFNTRRVAATIPLVGHDRHQDLLAKFPPGHGFRDLAQVPAWFATDLGVPAGQLPSFALARLHGAWTRGVQALAGGEEELQSFLVERTEAHGGICRLGGRAIRLVVRRGAVVGILEEGEDEQVGTSVVVSDQSGEAIADLANGEGITPRARRDWPRMTPTAGRFVASLVVAMRGLPESLGAEAFCLPRRCTPPDLRTPIVHLQRVDQPRESGHEAESLLVAEAILPVRGPLSLIEARAAILDTLRLHLPFIEDHIRVIDSPHDGLPLRLASDGRWSDIDRIHVPQTAAGPEPMEWMWTADPPGFAELAGEPVRGPIPGTYLVGRTVLPALGQEGALLAAWSAARVITHRDRSRQRMRQKLWTKIETG